MRGEGKEWKSDERFYLFVEGHLWGNIKGPQAKEFNLRRTTGIYVMMGEQCSGAVVGIIPPSVCTQV